MNFKCRGNDAEVEFRKMQSNSRSYRNILKNRKSYVRRQY
jgi:hypothetical protein